MRSAESDGDAGDRAPRTVSVEPRSLDEPVDSSDSEQGCSRRLDIRDPGSGPSLGASASTCTDDDSATCTGSPDRASGLGVGPPGLPESPSGSPDDGPESESEESTISKSAAVASKTHETSKTSEVAAAHDALQIDEDDEDSCPICFDIPKNGFRTPCGHVFCSTCLADALHRNDSCPVCRSRGVHTCATRTDDCPLCVAGHTPGVVVANVFVSQEENVLQSTARLAVTFSKIWCQVTSFSIGTVVLGFWLCEIGVLSILSFAMVCIGVTLVCCLVIYYRTSRAINRVIPADIPA